MRLFIGTALLVCLAFPAWAEPEAFVVHASKVQDRKAVVATIQSAREVQARARINGTVGYLSVKEGDHVESGEKIAVIGDSKLAIKGRGFEARVQAAQSAFDKAKLDLTRAQELRQSGYGTQARLDEMRAAYEIAQQNLEAVRQEKQEVVQQTSDGIVTAPNSGRVLKVPVSAGSVVMPGEVIAVLTQENYILRIEVPESHARFLKVGDFVEIGGRGIEADDKGTLRQGRIKLVYPDIQNGRVTADVEANDLGDYFVGERTRVYVRAGERTTYLIPTDMIRRLSGIDRVTLKDGKEVAIQTGPVWGDKTEVLAGLRENDIVMKP